MTINVAIIGCGEQGRSHLRAFSQLPAVNVAAVCDLDPERVSAAQVEFDVDRGTTDTAEIFGGEGVDAVSICTMPSSHAELAMAAMLAGLHVYVEKPAALRVRQVEEIVRTARATDRVLQVGFNMRYLKEAQYIRERTSDGTLGRPHYVRAWTKATNVPWWGRHYERAQSGGGALASTGVHVLDLALWLMAYPRVTTVTASSARLFPHKRGTSAPDDRARESYDVEDHLVAHLRCADGAAIILETGWMWDLPEWDYGIEMLAGSGTAKLSPLQIMTDDGTQAAAHVPPEAVLARPQLATDMAAAWQRSVDEAIADFIRAIGSDMRHDSDAQLIQLQRVVDAMYQSAMSGREVEVTP